MIRVLLATAGLAAWLAIRCRRPGWASRLPRLPRLAWRLGIPAVSILLAASASPVSAVGLAAAAGLVYRWGVRRPATLRRELRAEARAFEAALHAAGRPATFDEVALCILLQRFAGHGMARAEAAVLAGRCATLDDLGAQIALRTGGMPAYAAYIRRHGHPVDIVDAEQAAHGDRFDGR
ncbi:MAG: hypothetical protein ACE5IK_04225 [Acidobacteriota bacterium]